MVWLRAALSCRLYQRPPIIQCVRMSHAVGDTGDRTLSHHCHRLVAIYSCASFHLMSSDLISSNPWGGLWSDPVGRGCDQSNRSRSRAAHSKADSESSDCSWLPCIYTKHSPGGCTIDMPRRTAVGGDTVAQLAATANWVASVQEKIRSGGMRYKMIHINAPRLWARRMCLALNILWRYVGLSVCPTLNESINS